MIFIGYIVKGDKGWGKKYKTEIQAHGHESIASSDGHLRNHYFRSSNKSSQQTI